MYGGNRRVHFDIPRTFGQDCSYGKVTHHPAEEHYQDDASRRLTAREFLGNQRWLSGLQFLWNVKLDLITHPVSDDDQEVKSNVFLTQAAPGKPCTIVERLEYFSDWHWAKSYSGYSEVPETLESVTFT